MKLLFEDPLGSFLKRIGNGVTSLIVVSPFISINGANRLIEWMKRRNTKLKVLTNLSPTYLITALQDPIEPLKSLLESGQSRVIIKQNPLLHAKLYLVENKTALLGSSNLTKGGLSFNHELNVLINRGRSRHIRELDELSRWFDGIWSESIDVNLGALQDLEKAFSKERAKIQASLSRCLPEPCLGDGYWGKLRQITAEVGKDWIRRDVEQILEKVNGGKNGIPKKNTIRKLIFLQMLGLIRFSDKTVHVLRPTPDKLEITELLERFLDVKPTNVLKALSDQESYTYVELEGKLNLKNKTLLAVTIGWLEDLGYVKRLSGGYGRSYHFLQTEEGMKLMSDMNR